MSIDFYAEIGCDSCGNANHVYRKRARKGWNSASVATMARSQGMVFTKDGKHFCDKECYRDYKTSSCAFIPKQLP